MNQIMKIPVSSDLINPRLESFQKEGCMFKGVYCSIVFIINIEHIIFSVLNNPIV